MAQRGRKSAASLEVAALVAPVQSGSRLLAPAILSDAEQSVWAQLVNDQPADAFTPTHVPLLTQYCRHVIQAQLLADEIAAFDRAWLADEDGLKRYKMLTDMQERESRAMSSLATRLRITRQAVVDPKTAGRASRNVGRKAKPWEIVND